MVLSRSESAAGWLFGSSRSKRRTPSNSSATLERSLPSCSHCRRSVSISLLLKYNQRCFKELSHSKPSISIVNQFQMHPGWLCSIVIPEVVIGNPVLNVTGWIPDNDFGNDD